MTFHFSKGKAWFINILVTLIFGGIYYYFKLPSINLHDPAFYTFFFVLAVVYCGMSILTSGLYSIQDRHSFFSSVKNQCKVPILIGVLLIGIYVVGSLLSSPLLRASSYSKLLNIEQGDFTTDIQEASFDQIPMLGKESAMRLGDRKLGELSDMVSQFEVADDYSQINYQQRPVRVTPLAYGDVFKWLNNRAAGLPAYLIIDMVTQNTKVVRLKDGMKYSDKDHFSRNLYRHLRFRYPTYMFDTPNFEIDDNGQPYWICPKIEKTIGLFGGTDVHGAVLVNAVTGECQYYEAVPQWVDRVYSADLIMAQYDYHGTYIHGFLNSIFGQKGVTITTDGYNYIAQNDDVYVYTGITSVTGDQSNVGFILTNQRTKDTRYYPCAGAEEFSAMSSAEGVVQQLKYTATFPLLLNVSSQPTYFIPLKDNAGLVKMYAMVNVQQYNIVATAPTVAGCEIAYRKLLKQNLVPGSEDFDGGKKTGVLTEVRSAVSDGNSIYYLRLVGETWYYVVTVTDNPVAAIVKEGDTISLQANAADGLLRSASALELVP